MKVLAKFHGRVNKFNPPPTPSYVTLKDLADGRIWEADAVSELLLKNGIDCDNCEFEIIVHLSATGKAEATLTKLDPNTLSDNEKVDKIGDFCI